MKVGDVIQCLENIELSCPECKTKKMMAHAEERGQRQCPKCGLRVLIPCAGVLVKAVPKA